MERTVHDAIETITNKKAAVDALAAARALPSATSDDVLARLALDDASRLARARALLGRVESEVQRLREAGAHQEAAALDADAEELRWYVNGCPIVGGP